MAAQPDNRRLARGTSVELYEDRSALSIGDPRGLSPYLERASYFGPMDPNSLDQYFARKFELLEAERDGTLPMVLAALGLSGKEMWWWIEASFYRRHFGALDEAEAKAAYARQSARAHRNYVARKSADRERSAPAAAGNRPASVDGISYERWRFVRSCLAGCESDEARDYILAGLGIEPARYRSADAVFRAREGVDQ